MESQLTSHRHLYYKKHGDFVSKYRALLSRAFGPFNHIILRAPHRNIGFVPYIVWFQAYVRSCATAKKWLIEDLRNKSHAGGSSPLLGLSSDIDTERNLLEFASHVFQNELDEVLMSSLFGRKWFNVKALFSAYEPLKDNDSDVVTSSDGKRHSVYPVRGEPGYIPYDYIPTVDPYVGASHIDGHWGNMHMNKGAGFVNSNSILSLNKRSPVHVFSQELDIIPSCNGEGTASLLSPDAFHDIEMTRFLNTLEQQQQENSYTSSHNGTPVGNRPSAPVSKIGVTSNIISAAPGYIIIPFTSLHSLSALCTGRVEGSFLRRQKDGQSSSGASVPVPSSIASTYFDLLAMLLKNQQRGRSDHLYTDESPYSSSDPQQYVRFLILPPSFEVNCILKYKTFVDIKALTSSPDKNQKEVEGCPERGNIQQACATFTAALLDDPLCRCGLFSSVLSQTWYYNTASSLSSASLPVKLITSSNSQQFMAKVGNPFQVNGGKSATGVCKSIKIERKTVSRLIHSVEASSSGGGPGPTREYKLHRGVIDACSERAASIGKRAAGM